ncbi:MAG: hypothetical protein CMF46_00855 [Legionellales bacterium]|nr:hypothetical protein [Legionellales bacterium]
MLSNMGGLKVKSDFIRVLVYVMASGYWLAAMVPADAADVQVPSEESYLASARRELGIKQFKKSIQFYEDAALYYPFGHLVEIARLEVIYAYYSAAEFTKAEDAINRFKSLHPKSQNMDYALFMEGVINSRTVDNVLENHLLPDLSKRDLRNLTKAFVAFKLLIEDYPTSIYVKDAHDKLLIIKSILAKNMINSAVFYEEVGANYAAADRAFDYLRLFYGMPDTNQAFETLIASFHAEQLHDIVADIELVWQENQPD